MLTDSWLGLTDSWLCNPSLELPLWGHWTWKWIVLCSLFCHHSEISSPLLTPFFLSFFQIQFSNLQLSLYIKSYKIRIFFSYRHSIQVVSVNEPKILYLYCFFFFFPEEEFSMSYSLWTITYKPNPNLPNGNFSSTRKPRRRARKRSRDKNISSFSTNFKTSDSDAKNTTTTWSHPYGLLTPQWCVETFQKIFISNYRRLLMY